MSEAPFELVAGPLEAFIAPVGTAFPAVATEPPGGNWALIGTLGDDEYDEDGLSVQLTETIEAFRGLGTTGELKAFRTEEDTIYSFMVHDMTLEEWSRVLNNNSVTTSSNDKLISLRKGPEVSYRALLIRGNGKSPYGTGWNAQFEVPRVRHGGDPEAVFVKGIPAGLQMEFHTMVDLNAASDAARFGQFRAQFQ